MTTAGGRQSRKCPLAPKASSAAQSRSHTGEWHSFNRKHVQNGKAGLHAAATPRTRGAGTWSSPHWVGECSFCLEPQHPGFPLSPSPRAFCLRPGKWPSPGPHEMKRAAAAMSPKHLKPSRPYFPRTWPRNGDPSPRTPGEAQGTPSRSELRRRPAQELEPRPVQGARRPGRRPPGRRRRGPATGLHPGGAGAQ